MSTNYHTQHAPFGAFASFTIGLHDAPGGFGIGLGGPAAQNVYAGFRRADGPWELLPFFRETRSLADAFTTDENPAEAPLPAAVPAGFRKRAAGEFRRELGWASDRWSFEEFSLAIFSPFSRVADEAGLTAFVTAPLLAATLEYDNSVGGDTVELIFGINDPSRPPRPLGDVAPSLCGFAVGTAYGFAAALCPALRAVQGHAVLTPAPADFDGVQRIGAEAALVLTVPPGTIARLPLVLGFFHGGVVTTGLDTRYLYTRQFSALEDVLAFGLARHGDYLAAAADRDRELAQSALSPDQRWIVAQATHSYLGSSQLLEHAGRPLWNVNEGEYRMINTFDLTVDHLFFELRWHPWAVRNVLDLFADRYSYRDTVHAPDGRKAPGGISFVHDMGVADQFTPPGRSSYECAGLHGCFSYMTMEQLVNWVCCAVCYAEHTGDHAWLAGRRETLLACRDSLLQRDDPDPAQRNGVLKWDSDRCGAGSEITTYDSLDVSLGQARNNLYLAVKTLAAWLLLERAFTAMERPEDARRAGETIDRLAATLTRQFDETAGFFPAVFEAGNASRILPAVEGLVFPLFLGMDDALSREGRLGALLNRLEIHLHHALKPGVCLDAKSGAWKISSTSRNTWMSKVAIAQHVVRRLFPHTLSPAAIAADRVHADWQRRPGCGANAMCDQVQSETGLAIGSKYYPRIVTSVLWLAE